MRKILLTALLIQGTYSFSQNLVLHYAMDDMTSTTLPANNLSIHGTGTAPTFQNPGITGLPTDNYVLFSYGQGFVSDVALNNQTWNGAAISLWYNSEWATQGTLVQGAYLGFGVRILNGGKVQAFFNGTETGAGNSSTQVNDGQWHHILAQTDGTQTYIYIDGVLANSKTETFVKLNNPNPYAKVYIGNAANNESIQKITARVDDVKIYDDALSQAQIDTLSMSCLVTIPDVNFKAYLVANSLINTNGDSEIQCSEAEAFTGKIDCSSLSINDLTGIEAFTALTELFCQYNQLTSLDVSSNTALIDLRCFNNQLNNLDLSANTALNVLDFNNNNLTSLDVSANTLLVTLAAVNNELTSLDVSVNSALTYLNCRQNNLTSLNVKNGTNSILIDANFDARNNPDLTCIEVDDVTWSTANWTNKDNTASYSTDCDSALGINDSEMINLSLTIYPNPASDIINIQTDAAIISSSIYDFTGKLVATFSGNEYEINNLTNGIYFITIQTHTGTAQHKFVKQ